MQAIILAAGKGSRLGTLTGSTPKPLLKLNSYTILDRQIKILTEKKIKEITIITGYKANSIEDHLKKTYTKNNIKIIFNSKFSELDNLYSVWLSSTFINDDFILLNGDLVFDERIISSLLEQDSTPCLIVDSRVNFDSYSIITKNDVVKKINFDYKKNKPNGQYIGICKFNFNDIKLFHDILKKFHSSNDLGGEYVKIFGEYLEKNKTLFSMSTKNLVWFNVNNEKSLNLAKMNF